MGTNKRISELPLYSGDPSGSFIVMDNPSQTTTYKIRRENFLNPIQISGHDTQIAYFSGSNYVTSSNSFHVTNSGYTLSVGTSNVFSYFPERLIVDSADSYNIATFQTTKHDSYGEVNIKNYGSGLNASADLVLWNDVATESSSYVDLGINSSNYNGGQVGYGGDGYLFNQSNDMYIGSTGTGNHGHTHLFGGNLWQSASISIYQDGTIGFNTDKLNNNSTTIPTSGFTYEFSGSVKLGNNLLVDGTISTLNYTLPLTDGTSDQSLITDGSGNLSWKTGATGSSGTSGSSGSSGSSGTSGRDGIIGSNGTSGTSGQAGSSGTSGISISGSSGTSGTSGSSGTSGTSGRAGSAGTSGTSGIGISGSSGSSGTSGVGGIPYVSGLVNAGTFISLDNIKATVTTSGQRGLSLATISGTTSCYIGGTYGMYSGPNTGGSSAGVAVTTSASTSLFGWSFPSEGDTSTYIINYSYSKVYRITLMIGGAYNNNFISIERLY
jgi:hypothetical protein